MYMFVWRVYYLRYNKLSEVSYIAIYGNIYSNINMSPHNGLNSTKRVEVHPNCHHIMWYLDTGVLAFNFTFFLLACYVVVAILVIRTQAS
jgi:hypothetical protein